MAGPEHECRQGRRCKARIKDEEGGFHGGGVERPNSLCHSCETHAFDSIRQLSDDYLLLADARQEIRSRISGPKVSGSRDRPIPIPLAVDSLMCEIDDELLRWTLRITRGDPLPSIRVARCVEILSANLGTLVDLPGQVVTVWIPHPDGGDSAGTRSFDGVDAVLRLADLHRRTVQLLGLAESDSQKLAESCHVCGVNLVFANVKTDLVTCKSCRNVWHKDEFARLNNPLAVA